MRPISVLFSVAMIAALATSPGRAQMLAGTMQDVASSSSYLVDFTTGFYNGYAVYASPEDPSDTEGVPYTDSTNAAQFSNISGTFASGGSTDTGGPIELTFPYLLDGQPAVANMTTVVHYATAGDTLSMSSVLFASTEIFSFFLEDYEGPTSVTALLTGPGVTGTPTFTGSFSPLAGASYGYDVLTLTVTGAQTNDLLTFSVVDPTTGHAGIQAAAVVTPEPATWLLLVVGVGLLALGRRPWRSFWIDGSLLAHLS